MGIVIALLELAFDLLCAFGVIVIWEFVKIPWQIAFAPEWKIRLLQSKDNITDQDIEWLLGWKRPGSGGGTGQGNGLPGAFGDGGGC